MAWTHEIIKAVKERGLVVVEVDYTDSQSKETLKRTYEFSSGDLSELKANIQVELGRLSALDTFLVSVQADIDTKPVSGKVVGAVGLEP